MKRLTLLAVISCVLAAGGLLLAQSNPFTGTWKLDAAKSTFKPGPGPKDQTRVWAADGSVDVKGLDPAGQPVAYRYTIAGDGKVYKTTGAVPNAADAVSSTRVDARTIEAHFTRGGKPSDTTRFVVSADGKVLTITATGTRPDGGALSDVLVLNKQ